MKKFFYLVAVSIVGVGMLAGCSGAKSASNTAAAAKPAAAVSPTPQAQEQKFIADIPSLAGKTAKDVDAMLGQPVEVAAIAANRDNSPGEYRDYAVKGLETMQIRFHKDRAVNFTLMADKDKRLASAEEFANQFGFAVNVGEQVGSLAVSWKGKFGDAIFSNIKALKDPATGYFSLTADAD